MFGLSTLAETINHEVHPTMTRRSPKDYLQSATVVDAMRRRSF
jgi:hypothetical protein